MRLLVKVSFPHDQFNAAVRDGSAGPTIQRILEEQRPESVHFTEMGGRRTAVLFVDLADASAIPALAEPWYLKFGADVELHPAMSPEDLGRAGLAELGKTWG